MIHYFDASALAKRYLDEPGSKLVRSRLRRGPAAASRISYAELCAAVARAARERIVSDEQRDVLFARLDVDFHELEIVELRPGVLRHVPELVRRHPLRAYDAVQLAGALALARRGVAVHFWCTDRFLATAARAEELRVTVPEA